MAPCEKFDSYDRGIKTYRSQDFVTLQESDQSVLKTLNAAMILGMKLIYVPISDGDCLLVNSDVVIPAFTEDEDETVAKITYKLCQDDAFSDLSVAMHN